MMDIPGDVWQGVRDSIHSALLYVADIVEDELPDIPPTVWVDSPNEFYPFNGCLEFVKAPNTDDEVVAFAEVKGHVAGRMLTITTGIYKDSETLAELPPVELTLDGSRDELVMDIERAISRSVNFIKKKAPFMRDLLH